MSVCYQETRLTVLQPGKLINPVLLSRSLQFERIKPAIVRLSELAFELLIAFLAIVLF